MSLSREWDIVKPQSMACKHLDELDVCALRKQSAHLNLRSNATHIDDTGIWHEEHAVRIAHGHGTGGGQAIDTSIEQACVVCTNSQ